MTEQTHEQCSVGGISSSIGGISSVSFPDGHRGRYLIIANKTGQLGNRLVIYAHMLAAGFERGWTVLNPSFRE